MGFSNQDVRFRFNHIAKGKCECCKKQLVWENRDYGDKGAWHAHHVVPKSVKVDDSIRNMSILCINDPNCHLNQGHGGSFQQVQPKSEWECN